jgi:group I intron endonuclease
MHGIIYKATNILNGKVYIGKTEKKLTKRKCNHKFQSLKGDKRSAFQLALLDEGFNNFTWEQIDTFNSADELEQKEKYWVSFYHARDPQFGYNDQDGGIHYTVSAVTRKRISEAHKGKKRTAEARQRMSEAQRGHPGWNTGKHFSEETKRKMSEAMKGEKNHMFHKQVSDETRKKIIEARKGKHHTAETRKKLSEAAKGRVFTEEHRRKLSEAAKRRKHGGT